MTTTYPSALTDDNSIDLSNIFASNNTARQEMSVAEILDGYNNDGETETPLTSKPDANRFDDFWFRVHSSLAYCVNYVRALDINKLDLTGGNMSGALSMGSNKISGLADGTLTNDAVNKGQLDAAISGAWFLGEVKWFDYATLPTVPASMEVAFADGSALSRSSYSSYFSRVGITYGPGDGSTTFNMPDLRGKYTVGWNKTGALDPSRNFGSDQIRENSKFTWKYDSANPQTRAWNQTYTATEDGLVEAFAYIFSGGGSRYAYLTVNGVAHIVHHAASGGDAHTAGATLQFPISKGDTYIATEGYSGQLLRFFPKIQSSNNSTSTQTNIALYPVIRIK